VAGGFCGAAVSTDARQHCFADESAARYKDNVNSRRGGDDRLLDGRTAARRGSRELHGRAGAKNRRP